MKPIKDILNQLQSEEYKQLIYAFENGFEQYIKLPDDMFIGVNVFHLKHLEILQSEGQWAYGYVKDIV